VRLGTQIFSERFRLLEQLVVSDHVVSRLIRHLPGSDERIKEIRPSLRPGELLFPGIPFSVGHVRWTRQRGSVYLADQKIPIENQFSGGFRTPLGASRKLRKSWQLRKSWHFR
jgi:hypothetical protein